MWCPRPCWWPTAWPRRGREVIRCAVAQDAWQGFLESLLRRGLRGVQLVISDAHTGLWRAIRAALNGVSWQRCLVH